MSNTITAFFKGRIGVAEAVYQNDYGIIMNFDSIELPAHFDCYFSVIGEDEAIPGVGADRQVVIPNACLAKAGNVTLHIPLHTGANDSEVEYVVYFKVIGRARPADDGTPVQMSAIERALALLQAPLTNIEEIVNEALAFTGPTLAQLESRATVLESDTANLKPRMGKAESDIDVLEARVDSFTHLTEGSTTGDAELIDGRVGADGVTYGNIGTANRTQFTNLKSELNDLSVIKYGKNRFNYEDVTTGYYLDSNGGLVASTSWNTSGYCYVKGFTHFMVSSMQEGGDGTTRGRLTPFFLCSYDDNKNFIEQIASSPTYPITLDSDVAYIRFCPSAQTSLSTIQVENGNEFTYFEPYTSQFIIKDSARSEADVKDSEELEIFSEGFTHKYGKNRFNSKFVRGYLSTDGSLKHSTKFYTTDFIDVEGLVTVNASIKSSNKRVPLSMFYCCAYDENKDFVSYYGELTGSTITVASGTKYIRFSTNHDASAEEVQVEQGSIMSSFEPFSYIAELLPVCLPNKENALDGELVVVYSKNRCPLGFVSGYIGAGGTIYSSETFETTDYIDVTGLDYVTASCLDTATDSRSTVNMFYCCAYDENKTFISRYGDMPGSTIAIASGTHYIRFSRGDLDTMSELQVEAGQTPSAYVPYGILASSQNGLYKWYGKKWACVGDSLTEVNTRTKAHYFDYISDITGIRVVNLGVSGTGYARGVDIERAFYNRISSVPADTDVVTIFGSGNDGGAGLPLGEASDTGTSSLAGYINSTIDKLYLINPIISLGIVTPTPWVGNMPYDDGWMEKYSNLIVEICKRRSIPCLDLFHCSGLDPNSSAVRNAAYSKDEGGGVHPNEAGHKLIASKFKAFLESLII